MSNQPRNNPPPQQQQQQQTIMSKREMFDAGLATQEEQFKKMINPKNQKK